MEQNFPLPICGLHLVTYFQTTQYGEEFLIQKESKFTVEKLDKHVLSQLTIVNIHSDKSW